MWLTCVVKASFDRIGFKVKCNFMVLNLTRNKIITISILSIVVLQGCAGSINDRNREEAQRWANIWEEKPVEVEGQNSTPPQRPIIPEIEPTEQNLQQEILLSEQENRIKQLENNIAALSQHQQGLQDELEAVKEKNEKLEKVITDYQAVSATTNQIEQPSSSKGIHLASYKSLDNLKIGWKEYLNSGHQVILNKEARIIHTNVSGIEYLRLVVGPYSNTDQASKACEVVKQTTSFCNIIDFGGDILE